MRNAFIVFVIVAGFIWWDFLLLLSFVFKPRARAMRDAQEFEDKAISLIFSAFYAYGGFRPIIENRIREALPPRFLILANHQSLLDIPVIMHHMPVAAHARFIAKKELEQGVPLISTLLRIQGHCLVQRKGDPMHAMQAVAEFSRRSPRDGTCPAIFPEGTRSRTGQLGPFHSAGVRKYMEGEKLPVVVASVEGGWQTASLKDFFARFGSVPYRLRYLALLPAPRDKRETLATIARARELIAEDLGQ